MTQLVLPLHECAAEPLQDATESIANLAPAEPLHVVADPTAAGATLTETYCLCVWV
jgi:hypothetical protein